MEFTIFLYSGVIGRGSSVYFQPIGGREVSSLGFRYDVSSNGRSLANDLFVSKTSVGLTTARRAFRYLGLGEHVRVVYVGAIVLCHVYVSCGFGVFRSQGYPMRFVLGVLQRKEKRSTRVRFVYAGSFQLGGGLVPIFVYGFCRFVFGKQAVSQSYSLGSSHVGQEAVRVISSGFVYHFVYVNRPAKDLLSLRVLQVHYREGQGSSFVSGLLFRF